MFRTGAQFMMLVLLAGLALLRESRHEPLASWDNAFTDFLAMNSRHGAKAAPVVLVTIDDASLKSHPWPWSPLDYSLFFNSILSCKPEVVAIDQVLDWDRSLILPEEQNRKVQQYEKMLRDNILRTPKMLLGSSLGVPEDPQVIPPLQEVPLLRSVKGRLEDIPEFTAIEQQPAEGFRSTATVGFTNLPVTRARYNSVPLLFRYRGQVTPSFTLQAVMLWAQLTPDEVAVELGSHVSLGKKLRIPIDESGHMRVDFGSPRETMSVDELILASEQKEAGRKTIVPLDGIQGSIVLLSRTDADARTIPLAARRNGSPGELFADAIATIENQSFIQPAPSWTPYAIIAVFMIFGYRVPRMKKFKAVWVGFIVLTIYAMVALSVFGKWLIWLPGVMPLGVVVVCLLFRLATPDSFGRPKRPVIL